MAFLTPHPARRGAPLAVGLIGLCLTAPVFAATASQTIERVTLSNGGLAEIHRRVEVTGADTVRFDVPLQQVDDVLKSLLVDDAGGRVTGMVLDGLAPVDETFSRLPFGAADMRSVPRLAAALVGVPVRASSGGRTVQGVVLGVEDAPGSEQVPPVPMLSVLADSGPIQVLRLGADAVLEILDEAMRQRLREAATVSGRARTDAMRGIALSFDGEGPREVGLTYVVSAPVWKTTYRLHTNEQGQTRLQAWAVLENATGEDWQDVDLTLAAGAPVTLTQRLHQRYWHERAEVPVMVGAAAEPRPDTASEVASKADAVARRAPASLAAMAPPAPARAEAPRSVEASEGETTASWRLPTPVTLAAGQTLSLPFITDPLLSAERVSVFQPERGSIHPVAAVLLTNTAEASLPPGILTVYDARDGHVGDARLAGIPLGESRLASFADDRKVEITTDTQPQERIDRVTIVDGTLEATRVSRLVTRYDIKGAADAPREVIVEHPRRSGWRFESDALTGQTPSHHRLRAQVPAGGTTRIEAVAERTDAETFALLDADADLLLRWSGVTADAATAARLRTLAEARRELAQAERRIESATRELERATVGQARIRDNLAAVPPDSTLGQRYLGMLEEQEGQIAALTQRQREAEAERDTARDRLADAARG